MRFFSISMVFIIKFSGELAHIFKCYLLCPLLYDREFSEAFILNKFFRIAVGSRVVLLE